MAGAARLRSWGSLGAGWAFVAAFGALAAALRHLPAWGPLVAAMLLALPVAAVLGWRDAVGRIHRLHPYEPGRLLHWWAGRRFVALAGCSLIALGLTLAALFAGAFLRGVDWAILVAAPVVQAGASRFWAPRLAGQFRHAIYARRAVAIAAQRTTVALLAAAWLLLAAVQGTAGSRPLGEAVHGLQQGLDEVPSAFVRSGLDAAAWGVAGADAIASLALEPWSRAGLAALFLPLALFGFVSLALGGLGLGRDDWRRLIGGARSLDAPPPVSAATVATWSAVGAMAAMLGAAAFAAAEQRLRSLDRPFAAQPRPDCERIGATVYAVGTIARLDALAKALAGRLDTATAAACQALDEAGAAAAPGIESWLDWYFSLPAEWGRIAASLTGGAEDLLRREFEGRVLAQPGVADRLRAVDALRSQALGGLALRRREVDALLARHRLALQPGACRVVAAVQAEPTAAVDERFRVRLGGSVAIGSVAAAIGAKTAGKVGMKAAAKMAAKAAAAKGTGAAGGAMVGAAIGSVVPGAGTAVGAVVGAATGLVIGTAVDAGLLKAEEALTRDALRAELQAALHEGLQPVRGSLGCGR